MDIQLDRLMQISFNASDHIFKDAGFDNLIGFARFYSPELLRLETITDFDSVEAYLADPDKYDLTMGDYPNPKIKSRTYLV